LLGVIALAACDEGSGECRTRLECGEAEHCLVDLEAGRGACIDAPGRTPSPALQVVAAPPGVDVLLVIDDGPGTAEIQARVVAALPALVDEAAQTGARLRIAVTTTTVATDACATRAAAVSGRFAANSCLDRLDDFVGDDGTDDRWLCTESCTRTTAELPIDPDAPWIDLDAFPDRDEAAAMLACIVPQGTSGCIRPAPLGAIDFVTLRAAVDTEPAQDFFRGHGKAQVVIVSPRMDCTTTDAGVEAFVPDGPRTLWPDPGAEVAPPAVCWAAGVQCEGEPPVYDACREADRTLDGSIADAEADSVLRPTDTFWWLEYYMFNLHVIGGFADGGDIPYSTEGDAEFVALHGIGPACDDGTVTAAPALRLPAPYTEPTSICAPEYDAALRAAAGWVDPNLCVRPCLRDTLVIAQQQLDGSTSEIPACVGEDPALVIPQDASSCWAWRTQSPWCPKSFDTELLLRTRAPGQRGTFAITPNPWAPSTVVPGCTEPA
jgi:hypothetical protein